MLSSSEKCVQFIMKKSPVKTIFGDFLCDSCERAEIGGLFMNHVLYQIYAQTPERGKCRKSEFQIPRTRHTRRQFPLLTHRLYIYRLTAQSYNGSDIGLLYLQCLKKYDMRNIKLNEIIWLAMLLVHKRLRELGWVPVMPLKFECSDILATLE